MEYGLKITHTEKNKSEVILRFHYESGVCNVEVEDLRFVIYFRNLLVQANSCRPMRFKFPRRPSHDFRGMKKSVEQFTAFLKGRGGGKFVEKFTASWVQLTSDLQKAPLSLTDDEKKALV